MKALLIGSGSIGQRHVQNLLALKQDAQIVVMRQNKHEDDFVKQHQASIISAWHECPDDIEIVILANPSALHAQHIEKIIERNLPAYLEKPLLTSRADLERIKKQIDDYHYHQPTMMGCNLRFLPSIMALKQILEKGTLGNVCRVFIEAGQYLPSWRPHQDYTQSYSANKDLGGGVIFDLAHELDLVRFLFGDCEVLSSFHGQFSHLKLNVEDTAVIHLGKSAGPLISVHLDYVSRRPTRMIKIVGDEKTLLWDLKEKKLQLIDENAVCDLSDKQNDFDVPLTYQVAMREFLDCVNNRSQTSQPLLEGIKTTELLLQCKHS